jgi:hypothetical protein
VEAPLPFFRLGWKKTGIFFPLERNLAHFPFALKISTFSSVHFSGGKFSLDP